MNHLCMSSPKLFYSICFYILTWPPLVHNEINVCLVRHSRQFSKSQHPLFINLFWWCIVITHCSLHGFLDLEATRVLWKGILAHAVIQHHSPTILTTLATLTSVYIILIKVVNNVASFNMFKYHCLLCCNSHLSKRILKVQVQRQIYMVKWTIKGQSMILSCLLT